MIFEISFFNNCLSWIKISWIIKSALKICKNYDTDWTESWLS